MAQKKGEQALFSPEGSTVYYSRGTGASAETTALAVQALNVARVGTETVRGALAWLAANRDHRGTWHSTQGTVLALRAILMGATKDVDQTVKLSVNGGEAISAQVMARGSEAAVVDLAAKVKPGDNTITLEGSGEAPFQVVLTWVQPWREPGADEREALSLAVAYGRTKATVGDIVPVDLNVTYRRPKRRAWGRFAGRAGGLQGWRKSKGSSRGRWAQDSRPWDLTRADPGTRLSP